MGVFILDLSKEPSVETRVQTAMDNLKLYIDEKNIGSEYPHLLGLARSYIEDAQDLAEGRPLKTIEDALRPGDTSDN